MTTITAPESPAPARDIGRSSDLLPLGDRLVRAGLLTSEDLDSALNEQSSRNTRLGETLIELGFVSEDELLPLMGQHLGVT